MSSNKEPQTAKGSITESVDKTSKMADSLLEEIFQLRSELDVVLSAAETRDNAVSAEQPYSVQLLGDTEKIYQTLIEARYMIREISDRLSL